MKVKLGLGYQNYEDMMASHIFYVDKTNFIREWWGLQRIKGSERTGKRNISLMLLMAGITTRHGLPCRYMIMM